MALYLDDNERKYLQELLKRQTTTFWIPKKIQEKLQQEDERRQKIEECSHSPATYIGHKECCSQCGAYDEGQGFSWEKEQ